MQCVITFRPSPSRVSPPLFRTDVLLGLACTRIRASCSLFGGPADIETITTLHGGFLPSGSARRMRWRSKRCRHSRYRCGVGERQIGLRRGEKGEGQRMTLGVLHIETILKGGCGRTWKWNCSRVTSSHECMSGFLCSIFACMLEEKRRVRAHRGTTLSVSDP